MTKRNANQLPLAGVRILDLSTVVSAPMATRILGDQGASVIKVEDMTGGDLSRQMGVLRSGLSSLYINVNRDKRAMCLDLKKPEAHAVLMKLCECSDVLVHNYRPGVAERLGLGAEQIHEKFPELIYASLSGFGDSGPYSARRAYEPIFQGISGFVQRQVKPDSDDHDMMRTLVCDKSSGLIFSQAITAALYARTQGQTKQIIKLSVLDAALAFIWPDGAVNDVFLDDDAEQPPQTGDVYELTKSSDGYIVYYTATMDQLLGLFRALNRPEWCDDANFTKMPIRHLIEKPILEIISAEIAQHTTASLIERLSEESVPCGPVYLSTDDIIADPQVAHNQLISIYNHPTIGEFRQIAWPVRFGNGPAPVPGAPPLYGENTDDILNELGLSNSEKADLYEKKIAFQWGD